MKAVTGKVAIKNLEQYTGKEVIDDGIIIPEIIKKKHLNSHLTHGKIMSIVKSDSDKYGIDENDEVLYDTLSATYSQLEKGDVAIPIDSVILVKKHA